MNDVDLSFKTDRGRFIYRVGGIALHKGKILLVKDDRFDVWFTPGGKANMLETSDVALQREIYEELGVRPTVERVLWITERMFHLDYLGGEVHELSMLYLINFQNDAGIYQKESGVGIEANDNNSATSYFCWFDIDDLSEIKMIPQFLQSSLKDIPIGPKHIILNELEGTPSITHPVD